MLDQYTKLYSHMDTRRWEVRIEIRPRVNEDCMQCVRQLARTPRMNETMVFAALVQFLVYHDQSETYTRSNDVELYHKPQLKQRSQLSPAWASLAEELR